jgi:hypothetical protein
MTPDELIRERLWHYPTKYRDRSHVLEVALGSPDAGFGWVNGELINIFPVTDDATNSRDPAVINGIWLADWRTRMDGAEPSIYVIRSYQEISRRRAARVIAVRDGIDALVETRAPLETMSVTLAPPDISGRPGSPLLEIPPNATESWLLACEEVAHLIMECPRSTLHPGDPPASAEGTFARRASLAQMMGGDAANVPTDDEVGRIWAERWRAKADRDAELVAWNGAQAASALRRIQEIRIARQRPGTGLA